ncbi:MAG: hypothetical protein ABEJ28_05615 [Salinigranum sp.]
MSDGPRQGDRPNSRDRAVRLLGGHLRVGVVLVGILALAFALRAVPLYWSPLPSTLDGFGYAWQAQRVLTTGAFPVGSMRVDNFGYAGVLGVLGEVVGVRPVVLIQPATSVIGTVGVLFGIAVAGRLAGEFGWDGRRRAAAMAAAGIVLAVDGLYLRRTSTPDEEVLLHVLLPALLLAVHLALTTGKRRFWAISGLIAVVFPISHTFSTSIAGLSLVGLIVAEATRSPDRRTLLAGGGFLAGFWLYFGAYYALAGRYTALLVPYVDRIEAYPGLFVAWLVVLAVGVAWFSATTPRFRRLAVAVPLFGILAVLGANAVVPVFPGTETTPPLLLVPVLALAVPAAAASLAAPSLSPRRPTSAVVLGLLGGPLALIGFSLTAALTAEYMGTALRTQTFVHFPGGVLVGLALARYAPALGRRVRGAAASASAGGTARLADGDGTASRVADGDGSGSTSGLRRTLQVALVLVVLAALVVSIPLAYLNVDTATYPSTTLDSEFHAVQFASRGGVDGAAGVGGPWTTDQSLSRVGILYFRQDAGYAAAGSWLHGGGSPTCPAVSQRSWTTTGAHLFPTAPATVSPERYARWLGGRDLVYANTGRDPAFVSVPPGGPAVTC